MQSFFPQIPLKREGIFSPSRPPWGSALKFYSHRNSPARKVRLARDSPMCFLVEGIFDKPKVEVLVLILNQGALGEGSWAPGLLGPHPQPSERSRPGW